VVHIVSGDVDGEADLVFGELFDLCCHEVGPLNQTFSGRKRD